MFAYFAENANALTPGTAGEWGLGHIVTPGATISTTQCTSGPGGVSGLAVSLGDVPQPMAADGWRRMGPRTWIRQVAPVDPASLAKPTQLAGRSVQMADGQEWTVPAAICPASPQPNRLPRKLELSEAGEWIMGGVLPQYEAFWASAERCLESMLSPEGPQLTVVEQVELVVAALSLNYRVTKWELATCGALAVPHKSLNDALFTIVDLAGLEEIAKKNEPSA